MATGSGVRGRGRGRGPTRPGHSSSNPGVPKNKEGLGKYLFSLDESNFKQFGGQFAEMVVGYSTNEKRLEEAVDLIYDCTISNRDSAELGGMVCEAILDLQDTATAIPTEFKRKLLTHFQSDFKQKEALRASSVESWLGVFAFLCHIYKRFLTSGQPIAVMGKAILSSIEYTLSLEDVLDDEIDCICTHVKLCGELLESNHADRFEAVFVALKKLLFKAKTTCYVRCLVLELVELRYMKWVDKDKKLERFYADALADAAAEDELNTP